MQMYMASFETRTILIDTVHENNYRLQHLTMVHANPAGKIPAAPQRTTSEALLGAARVLVIVHNGREYRLTVTQNGKLILTA
jgi:hemin uptake protein HemP